jgi:16S rRNA processing protein RimM
VQLVAGRITRAHGVRGEVAVDVRTDEPATRFVLGAVLPTDPPEHGPLRVVSVRSAQGRLLLRFADHETRTSAESIVGVKLLVEPSQTDDPDAFYDHELVGLAVIDGGDTPIGSVADVMHQPGHDLLVIDRGTARHALVPFVEAIVPVVDVPAGRLVIHAPPGLLDDTSDDHPADGAGEA